MKISREWLSDYVDLGSWSDQQVADRLTEIGHAVEAMESHEGDTVFEIEFTTNRIDAMSHLGLARELAAAFGTEVKFSPRAVAPVPASNDVKISIEAPQLCTRFSGLIIRGVNVKPSPVKVRRRLEAVGLRPINNVVDATNYVMMAIGHPLHAYDLELLHGPAIRVLAGQPGEMLVTLDNEKRKLDGDSTVIADADRAVGLGGIMGGQNTEISDSTRNVLLECAHFESGAIRRTARRLGMKTDASYRFERGADPGDTLTAITLAGDMIAAEAGGTLGDLIDVVAVQPQTRRINLRTARLHEISGGVIGIGYALELFRRLGMEADVVTDGISVVVPTYRVDLEQEIDLLEEVLRFYGYNKIPASLPRLTTGDVRHDPEVEAEESLRDILVSSGMIETITYSFIHPELNAIFSSEEPMNVSNALTENLSSMRLTLFPGLLEVIAHNRSYGNRDGAFFEVGKTYHRAGDGVREQRTAAMVFYGAPPTHWATSRRGFDFFDLKGVIEAIAHRFNVELEFRAVDVPWMKKGQAAAAFSGGRQIAVLGAVASEVVQKFDARGDVFAGQLSVADLVASVTPRKIGNVSRFPGVPMVLPLLHDPSLSYETIVKAVRAMDVPNLREVGIWDRFTRDNAAAGEEIKTAIGLWYQADDRSLTQEEINETHEAMVKRLVAQLPVKVMTS